MDKLPELWYVERNETNAVIINKWHCDRKNDSGAAWSKNKAFFYSNDHYSTYRKDGYQEISFEEFERLVLNPQKEPVLNNSYELY